MKLDSDINIPDAKLGYLLNWRQQNDKSGMMARLGFTPGNEEALRQAIVLLIVSYDAIFAGNNGHGDVYEVTGELIGPSGSRVLVSVWIQLTGQQSYNFVTLRPPRRR